MNPQAFGWRVDSSGKMRSISMNHAERVIKELKDDKKRLQTSAAHYKRAAEKARAERDAYKKRANDALVAMYKNKGTNKELAVLHDMIQAAARIGEHLRMTEHDGHALVDADDLRALLLAVGVIR